jgi:hypothetical protein
MEVTLWRQSIFDAEKVLWLPFEIGGTGRQYLLTPLDKY